MPTKPLSMPPLRVETTRGPVVESQHLVWVAMANADGELVAAWGDVDQPVHPRSAIKPIQALPLIETGAADATGMDDADLALACSSHAGEPAHVDRVTALLARLGLSPGALACGGHAPGNAEAADALIRAGRRWTRAHDNCSGKHAGFLATAVHLGEPLDGYEQADHPVQQRTAAALGALAGIDMAAAPAGTDGCGIPAHALPLRALAAALARFAAADPAAGLSPARCHAARRLQAAMAAHPVLVAGTGRFDTDMIAAGQGRILVKGGAEGVHAAMLPDQRLGIALKVADGAGRASAVALGTVLDHLGLLGGIDRAPLADHLHPILRTRTGTAVGEIRAVLP